VSDEADEVYGTRSLAKMQTAQTDQTYIVIGVDDTAGEVVLRFMPTVPTDEDIDMFEHRPIVAPRHVCVLTVYQAGLLAELLTHAAHHAGRDTA
jgi:hypothetical protein